MQKYFLILLIMLAVFISVRGYTQHIYSGNLAHTYSIVARDPATGEMGVAVQSHWFSVGSIVSWAEAGVGAVATQSFTNPSFGPRGLAMLKEGIPAEETLQKLIASDDGRDVRQLAIIDSHGNAAAWTGEKCIPFAGHYTGDNFSMQANLMLYGDVWSAMAEAYVRSEGQLADRMLRALEAAQHVGGDIRGKQSAALLVVRGEATGRVWEDRKIDLRVEDHPEPIQELKRLLQIHTAYEHMNKGDVAMEHGNAEEALREYTAAEDMFPENLEMKYWHAVSMANNGMVKKSLVLFQEIFRADENWRTLTQRLPAVELLKVSNEELQLILSQK